LTTVIDERTPNGVGEAVIAEDVAIGPELLDDAVRGFAHGESNRG
jgi:hypothetical protein